MFTIYTTGNSNDDEKLMTNVVLNLRAGDEVQLHAPELRDKFMQILLNYRPQLVCSVTLNVLS